ncbi:S41 family peptidase [Ramlibacter sp.]|uniref:S41 family peptidase n=1 Tax=Ramlibacter sp. TaxID=1917967 RepID=UPI003D146C33
MLLVAGASSAASPTIPGHTVAAVQSAFEHSVVPGEPAAHYRDLIATVFERIERSYAAEVDVSALAANALKSMEPVVPGTGEPAVVFKAAINAALKTLDGYSRYIDPQSHANERSESGGSFGGVGMQVEPGEGVVRVVSTMPGNPAERAGVKAGDLILRIDDVPLQGVPLADAIARMRGQPGTTVSVTLRRGGAEAFTVAITRDTIRRQTVQWRMEGDVLVLKLASFTTGVAVEIEKAVALASAEKMPRAVTLDMRGNPGGLLREAVLIADLFLSEGTIVSLRRRPPSSYSTRKADANEILPGVPMVVLIDGRSASASELVAAALQENGRAKVMGQRSYGKGTVQTTYGLGEAKGALKITTSVYHGPLGTTVNKSGVAPDIELVSGSPSSAAATAAAVAAATGPDAVSAPVVAAARIDPSRCPALYKVTDLPVACAVGYLRTADLDGFMSELAERAERAP